MAGHHQDNRLIAVACILAGVGFASLQDAIVKQLSGSFPAYETLMLRSAGAVPALLLILWRQRLTLHVAPGMVGRVLLRGSILGAAYLCFVLALAAMPLADGVAIYFTMPFFVAGLAGPLLGETVRPHRWLAIVAGFIGVIVVVRPGIKVFEPANLLALMSALGYAVGQMIGRPLAQHVPPAVIATWQTAIYFSIGLGLAIIFNTLELGPFRHPSLVFLSRGFVWPDLADFLLMTGMGVLSALGMVLFVNAYKYGETNFVAPFEYSAMVWALIYGVLLFGDFPDRYTFLGAGLVITAGLLMVWWDRRLDRTSRRAAAAPSIG